MSRSTACTFVMVSSICSFGFPIFVVIPAASIAAVPETKTVSPAGVVALEAGYLRVPMTRFLRRGFMSDNLQESPVEGVEATSRILDVSREGVTGFGGGASLEKRDHGNAGNSVWRFDSRHLVQGRCDIDATDDIRNPATGRG